MPSASVTVRVQPRAKRDEIVAVRDGVIVVRLAAPPLDGRANQALARFLAARLDVRAAQVTIVRGERSREKVVRVDGVLQSEVDTALAP